jgi:hypothetical protein
MSRATTTAREERDRLREQVAYLDAEATRLSSLLFDTLQAQEADRG